MGQKQPRNKSMIQKVWVENDQGSTKRGWNIEVQQSLTFKQSLFSEKLMTLKASQYMAKVSMIWGTPTTKQQRQFAEESK